jgi:hypothetical protein
MAYLTLIASIAESEIARFREGSVEAMAASKIEYVSHYLAYGVAEEPLRQLLGQAIDGGEPLREDLWHPFRSPLVQTLETVKTRWLQLSEAWSTVLRRIEVAEDDWYKIEITKVLDIFEHASRNTECIVSALEPPADFDRAKRVRIPIAVDLESKRAD